MKVYSFLISCILLGTISTFAQQQDSVKIYEIGPVEVTAKKEISLFDRYSYGANYSTSLFDRNGFNIIRRGLNFTQDLYAEGFRGGDIKVVVDGELYYNSCPNRMDAEVVRINPLDMKEVDLSKTGSLLNAGIFGKVEYHRSKISSDLHLSSYLIRDDGSQKSTDFGASLDLLGSNFSFRYSDGKPYENANTQKFSDLYSYKDNYKYTFINAGFRHQKGDLEFGTSFTLSENISFPYLMMDEINSKVYSSFVSYKGNKIYVNYTNHLMNNTLRKTNMFMETNAKNITIGITGSFYEFNYRYWTADNVISSKMMNVDIQNKLMPDINQVSFSGVKDFSLNPIYVTLKGGMQYFKIGAGSGVNFFHNLYPDADDNNFYFTGGMNLFYSAQLSKSYVLSFSTDITTTAPEAEELFRVIERPMMNPNWSGNPTLNQPIKATFRSSIDNKYFKLEGFANYISNYVNLTKRISMMKNYITYENINAIIAGANLGFKYEFINTNISYLYGKNQSSMTPLSEIVPLSITTIISSPELMGLNFSLIHKYENAQKMVDEALHEVPSQAWNIFNVKTEYNSGKFYLNFEVENLFNKNYSRFLSYSRDPFASGSTVYEPGRSYRLTISFDGLL